MGARAPQGQRKWLSEAADSAGREGGLFQRVEPITPIWYLLRAAGTQKAREGQP